MKLRVADGVNLALSLQYAWVEREFGPSVRRVVELEVLKTYERLVRHPFMGRKLNAKIRIATINRNLGLAYNVGSTSVNVIALVLFRAN
jgi:plasmid stabilization system protein ParE